jgi:hypothetical protein
VNDLAIASDGTVYLTDMIGGAVYRERPRRAGDPDDDLPP